jgi:hypothetical protein
MSGSGETIVLITIWVLTLAGVFFGGRAAWRRRRRERDAKGEDR